MFYLKIPVKPHIKHYLTYQFGDPYKVDQNDGLGVRLFTFLRKPLKDNRKEEHLSRYTEEFTIVLSKKNVFQYGCSEIDPNSIVLFNSEIDDQINDLYLAIMDARTDMGDNYADAIRYFMSRYNYFDMNELNFEMLKKRYYRYRKEMEKNSSKEVPQLSLNLR